MLYVMEHNYYVVTFIAIVFLLLATPICNVNGFLYCLLVRMSSDLCCCCYYSKWCVYFSNLCFTHLVLEECCFTKIFQKGRLLFLFGWLHYAKQQCYFKMFWRKRTHVGINVATCVNHMSLVSRTRLLLVCSFFSYMKCILMMCATNIVFVFVFVEIGFVWLF